MGPDRLTPPSSRSLDYADYLWDWRDYARHPGWRTAASYRDRRFRIYERGHDAVVKTPLAVRLLRPQELPYGD